MLVKTDTLSSKVVWVLTFFLSVVVFVLDLTLPLGVAGGVPYVIVVLLTVWQPSVRATVFFSIETSVLTVLGYFFSPPGGPLWMVWINRAFAISAIVATTLVIIAQKRLKAKTEKVEIEFSASLRDTERRQTAEKLKRMEQDLAHMNRVSSMGELAIGLAHELNQPLGAISTLAQAGVRQVDHKKTSFKELRTLLQEIKDDVHHASGIIKSLKRFVARSTPQRGMVDLNQLVESVLALLRGDFANGSVEVIFESGRDIPRIYVDPIQIQQVLVNLLLNSLEALANSSSRRRIGVSTSFDGKCAVVQIVDSGPFVSDEVFGRMFKQYFSTKPDGLGVGLSICKNIIDWHEGLIELRRDVECGIVATIKIPCKSSWEIVGVPERDEAVKMVG